MTRRRTWTKGRVLIGLMVAMLTVIPGYATAEVASFNPALLIEDDVFLSSGTMSGDMINTFLKEKGSWLADLIIPEFSDVPYFCKTEQGENVIQTAAAVRQIHTNGTVLSGVRAADLLAERASVNAINPQVILALLERESSGVTKAAPSSNFTREWPLFYGFDEVMASYGYSCQAAELIARDYGGIGLQIAYGTFGIKNNYTKATDWSLPFVVDGQTLTVLSQATRALYRYTPHIRPGNYNFWLFFTSWFQSWQGSIMNQTSFPTIAQGGSAAFQVSVQNTGTKTWQQSQVKLATSRTQDRTPVFLRQDLTTSQPSGWLGTNRIQMQEISVAPGATATFRFWMSAPTTLATGTYREYFQLVADGAEWFQDMGLYWDITVIEREVGIFDTQLASQNDFPTLGPGDVYQFVVGIRNSSLVTWTRETVRLGTARERDRTPLFLREDRRTNQASGWLASNRIQMQESRVAPGETATFRFWMTVPNDLAAGTYREYFQPVADGVTWMEDLGLYWDITVVPLTQAYRARLISQSNYPPALARGDSAEFVLELQNTGISPWQQRTFRLGTDRTQDRIPRFERGDLVTNAPSGWVAPDRVQMQESWVSPGEIATFRFWYTVPSDRTTGTYREYFRPVVDGIGWLSDLGIYWDLGVR